MAYIPENYDNQGKLFNGTVDTRNALEAGVVGYVGYAVCFKVLPLQLTAQAIVFCIVCLPLILLCLAGIGGDSAIKRLTLMNKFRKNKRKLHYIMAEQVQEDTNNEKRKKKRRKKNAGNKAQRRSK